MSEEVTVPSGHDTTEVQGYRLRQLSGEDRTVVVDDQGAVHLPPVVLDDNGSDADQWLVNDENATAPITRDPDPVEDPAGRFHLYNGTWRPA